MQVTVQITAIKNSFDMVINHLPALKENEEFLQEHALV